MQAQTDDMELEITQKLTDVISSLVRVESTRMQKQQLLQGTTCTKPAHVYGEILEAVVDMEDCYKSIVESHLAFFREKIAERNPQRTSKEILQAVRDHSVDCAVKAIELAAIANMNIETIKEWSDEVESIR